MKLGIKCFLIGLSALNMAVDHVCAMESHRPQQEGTAAPILSKTKRLEEIKQQYSDYHETGKNHFLSFKKANEKMEDCYKTQLQSIDEIIISDMDVINNLYQQLLQGFRHQADEVLKETKEKVKSYIKPEYLPLYSDIQGDSLPMHSPKILALIERFKHSSNSKLVKQETEVTLKNLTVSRFCENDSLFVTPYSISKDNVFNKIIDNYNLFEKKIKKLYGEDLVKMTKKTELKLEHREQNFIKNYEEKLSKIGTILKDGIETNNETGEKKTIDMVKPGHTIEEIHQIAADGGVKIEELYKILLRALDKFILPGHNLLREKLMDSLRKMSVFLGEEMQPQYFETLFEKLK